MTFTHTHTYTYSNYFILFIIWRSSRFHSVCSMHSKNKKKYIKSVSHWFVILLSYPFSIRKLHMFCIACVLNGIYLNEPIQTTIFNCLIKKKHSWAYKRQYCEYRIEYFSIVLWIQLKFILFLRQFFFFLHSKWVVIKFLIHFCLDQFDNLYVSISSIVLSVWVFFGPTKSRF